MKALSELGISPTPWDCHKQFVTANDDGSVVAAMNVRDARLIAAAPELYKALFDLALYGETILDWDAAPTHIKASFMLKIKNAKKAIAKASGEEVEND